MQHLVTPEPEWQVEGGGGMVGAVTAGSQSAGAAAASAS